jgi:glycerol transport system substrate-binding protein
MTSAAAMVAASVSIAAPAFADDAVNQKWIDSEFQPSTLSKADQLKELQWFEKAAQPFKGMEINVVSNVTTQIQSKTLGLQEITGIKVTHDLIQEGRSKLGQWCGENIYDAWSTTPT